MHQGFGMVSDAVGTMVRGRDHRRNEFPLGPLQLHFAENGRHIEIDVGFHRRRIQRMNAHDVRHLPPGRENIIVNILELARRVCF